MDTINECLRCGACCASFRVSFYWAEIDDAPGGYVPAELTEPVNAFLCAMRGTNQKAPYCVALQGEVGKSVSCAIYQNRPTTCREFHQSWESGLYNETCDHARQMWGLEPLSALKAG